MLNVLSENDWPGPPVNQEASHTADQIEYEVVDLLDQGSPGQHPDPSQDKGMSHKVEQLQSEKQNSDESQHDGCCIKGCK